MLNMRASMLLAGVLVLSVTACGGGGGGGAGLTPTPEPPPPTPNTPLDPAKALVPEVSSQATQEGIIDKIGGQAQAADRQKIASNMELGSMTQSTQPGFVMGLYQRGDILNHNGQFTITSSHTLRTDESVAGDTCRCSISYLAGFYDEDGYELMEVRGNGRAYSLSAPLLYPDAKYGFIYGYFYQGTNFGVFADATAPTTLRHFGSATYGSNIKGYMSGLEANKLVPAQAWTTMTVTWGEKPAIQGRVHMQVADLVSVDIHGTTLYPHQTLAAVLTFDGTEWSDEHKAFHNGTIGCVSRCQTTSDSTSKWGAMLVDNGSGGVDPYRLVGTFGLYQYELDSLTVDWIGWMHGETPFNIYQLDRGYGLEPRSPGRAMVRRVGREVSHWLRSGKRHEYLGTVNAAVLDKVIHQAATIDAHYYPGTQVTMYFEYNGSYPVVQHGFGFARYQDTRTPIGNVSWLSSPNTPIPMAGSASYSGLAGGFYTSRSAGRGGFVATIDLGVEFAQAGPALSGAMGYDFGGVTGKLSMTGGTWMSSIASFNHGSLECDSGCQDAGTVAVWSAHLIDVTGGSSIPEGAIGKFGAMGLQQGQHEYDMYGIFAAYDNAPVAPRPAISTYFPATPHDMVSGAEGRYRRGRLPTFLEHNYGIVDAITSTLGNFVHAGSTIQLATNQWDWRSDDYANCYCTMFLTGSAFDSRGNEIKGGLSSDPRLRWGDSSEAKYGWVAGLWRRDNLPNFWQRWGKTELGLFVEGSAPDTLPSSGSAIYLGYGTSYAMPTSSTITTDIEVIHSTVSFNVAWGNTISVSGKHFLPGLYGNSTVMTDFYLTLEAEDDPNINPCNDCAVGWTAWKYIKTRDGETIPGVFAGVHAISSVSVIYYDSALSISLSRGVWDIFGWFSAQPTLNIDRKDELLKLPERAVKAAIQEGFDQVYFTATDAQRDGALEAAGQATIDLDFRDSKVDRFGYVSANSNHTGFWTYTTSNDLSIGIRSSGVAANSTPTSGKASYTGNAAGFYKSANGEGVMIGDVSMAITFVTQNVLVSGRLDLDFGGTTGSFPMHHGWFTGPAIDGNLGCGTGCEGVWGGNFVETADNRSSNTAPGGFLGSFGMDGAVVGTVTYDALGAFSATVEP